MRIVMTEFKNGFEFLQKIRELHHEKDPSLNQFQRYMERKARENGTPITGQFELTPLCNLDCKMCYVHLTKNQMCDQPVMEVSQWKDLMRQAWETGMYKVILTGGECLAYPGFKDLYLYLHSLGCEITVLTNGCLLDDEWVSFFVDHPPVRIRLTLYGHDEETYERVTGSRCFHTVREHIIRMTEAGLPLIISITPNLYLGTDVFETIRTAKALCSNVFVSAGIFEAREETGRAGQHNDMDDEGYLQIYQLLDKLEGRETSRIPEEELPPVGGPSHETAECGLECGGGSSSFSIDWKGIMHPCTNLPEVEAFPLRDGFQTAWKELREAAGQWPRVAECEGCAYSTICTRCAAFMKKYAKPGSQPVKMCERVKNLVRNGVWRVQEFD